MKCPNCGDTLIYDAASKLLVCRSCDSKFRPKNKGSVDKTRAQEVTPQKDESLLCTIFTCGSCGAELAGTYENSALGFCPYCGGESILASRLKTKRPSWIIPFSKTKKQCRAEYLEMVSKLAFVPKELKDPQGINEIRGIYIPYNIYHARHKGALDLEYSTDHGNTTDYYSLTGNINSHVYVPVDGSTQLDDNIGAQIFAFDREKEVPFNEEYLATYYVELPDANDTDYKSYVRKTVIEQEIKQASVYTDEEPCTNKKEDAEEEVKVTGKHIVLSPVYFLTYRKKDRVCYTVIPGIKDKKEEKLIYSEVPVDTKTYTAVMIAVAVILWAALSFIPFIPTFKHTVTLKIFSLLTAIAMCLQGLSYSRQVEKYRIQGGDETKKDTAKKKDTAFGFIILCIFIFIYIGFSPTMWLLKLIPTIIAVLTLKYAVWISKNYPQIKTGVTYLMLFLTIAMVFIAVVADHVFLRDEVVYTIMTIIMIPVVICFMYLINTFNESCTRPLPHFTRKGGHDSANDI